MQLSPSSANWIRSLRLFQNIRFAIVACCVAMPGLAGCSAVPTAGPTASQVMDQAAREPRHFDLVEIDSKVVSALASYPKADLPDRPEFYNRPPDPTIGIGDTVAVSIWQASNAQIFVTQNGPGQAGAGITIPDQVVGADGAISMPYAGRVAVAGRTPLQVQQTIEQRLAEQLIHPQAIVTVTKAISNSVTVVGEEGGITRVPLSAADNGLLEVIAAAGGSKAPIYDTSIRLTRNGQTTTIPMTAVESAPQQQIVVWPGDIITLVHTPERFSVFGATTNNAQVPFDTQRLDLAQAIAKAGGLQDQRADPDGVFLLRFEPPAVVNALGVPNLAGKPEEDSPVLYHLNLRQINGYFLAERFPVRNKDLIYVANAPITDLQKFFTLVGTITGPVIAGTVTTRATNPH